jgi:CDP-glucose 4,6-dehydratase
MKNILITGGTGFLGSYIARRLVNDVDSITIVTLDIKQKTSLKALDIDMNKINLVKGEAYGSGEVPYQEDYAMNGEGIYEVSKSCTDLVARSYFSNYGLPVVVTRCSNLYGGADMNMSRIIPNTIRLALEGKSPVIWKGSEKSIREFLYVEDAVDGYLSLIKNIDKTKGEAFNIGSKEIVTIEDIVNKILSKINKDISINYQEKDFPEISSQYLSSDKIENYTGWRASTSLSDGLDKSIEMYKSIL